MGHGNGIAIKVPLTSSTVGPVPLNGTSVFVGLAIENISLEEFHSHLYGSCMFLWHTAVVLVLMVEVILV